MSTTATPRRFGAVPNGQTLAPTATAQDLSGRFHGVLIRQPVGF
jgi:hypothetical protein